MDCNSGPSLDSLIMNLFLLIKTSVIILVKCFDTVGSELEGMLRYDLISVVIVVSNCRRFYGVIVVKFGLAK